MAKRVIRRKRVDLPKLEDISKVKVGLPAGKDSDIIKIGIWNHFGTQSPDGSVHIPERPFLYNAMRDNAKSYRAAMKKSAPKILRGETDVKTVLSKLGIKAAGDVQQEITDLQTPENAASTIAAKGSSNPLIDQGTLRRAITWETTDD